MDAELWMDKRKPAESHRLCHWAGQLEAFQGLQSLAHPKVLTSYCCGKFRMDGNGLTDTHFLLALDITRRTLLSLVQL